MSIIALDEIPKVIAFRVVHSNETVWQWQLAIGLITPVFSGFAALHSALHLRSIMLEADRDAEGDDSLCYL